MVVVAFGILGVAKAARPVLPSVLRGPIVGELVRAYGWSGVYGGAQAGFSTASMNFNQNVGALVADMLRLTTIEQDFNISSWPVLGKPNPVGGSYGGFVGYNWQWEDAVTGFEINYNRTSLSGSASNSLSRSFVDSNPSIPTGHHYFYNPATVTRTAAARVTDWGTFRFRGGWAAGMFLPYGFVAFAVGRADISRSASVTWTVTDLPDSGVTPFPPSALPVPPSPEADARNGVFAYGAAAGLGAGGAPFPNLFFRLGGGFLQFSPLPGAPTPTQTARPAL